MAIFGQIWTQFRSKQLKIWPESHRIDPIDLIRNDHCCLDLNWVQIGPKMAIFVTGNGNYNSLFSKIFEIFDYFRTVVPYFEYFRVIFVNSSFAFSSPFVSRVPQSTEPLYFFKCKFKYEKKTVSSFAKMENPEKKSFRIALVNMPLRFPPCCFQKMCVLYSSSTYLFCRQKLIITKILNFILIYFSQFNTIIINSWS
jgi:hypothetical protein